MYISVPLLFQELCNTVGSVVVVSFELGDLVLVTWALKKQPSQETVSDEAVVMKVSLTALGVINGKGNP